MQSRRCIRSSTQFVAYAHRKKLSADLRRICGADTDATLTALSEFEKTWGERYPMVGKA